MDETVKPLRIPPQMSVYADKYGIFHLMQSMVSSLVVDRPDDPIAYLIGFLQRRADIPRIMVLGPPAVGKRTVSKKLSVELGAVHVTKESLLQEQTELSQQAREYTVEQREVPLELMVQIIQQRLSEADCFNNGWVLEGIPETRLLALNLQQVGVIPEHVVMLQASSDVLMERRKGKLVDPVTGDVYHQTFIWQVDDDVVQRLAKGLGLSEKQHLAQLQLFRCEVTGLMSAYQHVLKIINSDQPHADVSQQALAFVKTHRRSRTPRILLFGPPGSGKSQQARLLSQKYRIVEVCCGHLLRSVAAEGSELGKMIQPYLNEGQPIPDNLVLQIIEQRLRLVDCSCRGWVLHGFPRDLQQATMLKETQQQPNRVFFLELTDDDCLERLSKRATDPVTGERYHAVTRPAPSTLIRNRLMTRPDDSEESVKRALAEYRTHTAALQSVFPDAVRVDAEQDPHSVFEALESRLNTV